MSRISRRDFLKSLSIAFGAAFVQQYLTACDQNYHQSGVTQLPIATTQTINSIYKPGQSTAQSVTPGNKDVTSTVPDLVVAYHGEPEELVRQALIPFGGMKRFVSNGDYVIIKPNICVSYHTYEYAATTNPWVVGALVRQCIDAGAGKVQVMDYPFGGSAEEAYIKSGIAEQVKAAGGEMVVMPHIKFVPTDIPEGIDLRTIDLYEDITKADVLINVPIAKHHSLARLTLGMKNWMGVIASRQLIHRNLGQRLADLSSRIRPTLTVVDAVRLLMNNGPSGGNLADVKKIDTIIASTDIVAADSYATTLFDLNPEDISYIKAGSTMGLGRSDINNLRIEEINIGA